MTDQEIRIAIAEACGWKFQEGTEPTYGGCNIPRGWINPKTNRICILSPDYLNDLNAMHEAEKVLTDIERSRYGVLIDDITGATTSFFDPIHATARQRAEAFLRTIGKWKD